MRTVKPVPLTEEQKTILGKPYDVGEWYYIAVGGQIIQGGPYNTADANARVDTLVEAGKPKPRTPGDDGPK